MICHGWKLALREQAAESCQETVQLQCQEITSTVQSLDTFKESIFVQTRQRSPKYPVITSRNQQLKKAAQ